MEVFGLFVCIYVFAILFSLTKGIKDNKIYQEDEALKKYIIERVRALNLGDRSVAAVSFKKFITKVIFSIISFVVLLYVFLYHDHYIIVSIIEIIAFIVTIIVSKKFNEISYLAKQIKASPDDNMDYIITGLLQNGKGKKTVYNLLSIALVICAFGLPFLIFNKPVLLYESSADGYVIRYYSLSLNPEENISIPAEYKGKKVVGIRGDVFKNMSTIRTVELPDTITEIRGGAFQNCKNLENINMPSNLTYIGGYAFANTKLTSVIIPDSVTEIRGGAFSNVSTLRKVQLSSKITEIHGSTFEYTGLVNIDIPNGVTRIGGHAFHGCSSLRTATIPESVREIGSSAFRDCTSLQEVTISRSCSVNERAFKNSGTTIYYYGESRTNESPEYNSYNSVSSSGYSRYGY